jgi:hypothetical protein
MALLPFVGLCPLFFGFVILYTVGRTPWAGDQPVARSLLIHTRQHEHNINTDIHASSWIRTHDSSLCLRLRAHCDWLNGYSTVLKPEGPLQQSQKPFANGYNAEPLKLINILTETLLAYCVKNCKTYASVITF